MSTRFDPRPYSVSNSPARPSTGRSTVRAVTPSPQSSLSPTPGVDFEKWKDGQVGTLPVVHNGNVKYYVLNGQESDCRLLPEPPATPKMPLVAKASLSGLQRQSAPQTPRSALKQPSCSNSLIKCPQSVAAELIWCKETSKNFTAVQDVKCRGSLESHDAIRPYAFTPITTGQERSEINDQGTDIPTSDLEKDEEDICDMSTRSNTVRTCNTIKLIRHNQDISRAYLDTHPSHSVRGRKTLQASPPCNNSISAKSVASGDSKVSKHSVFNTPGRDELERKKILVEADDGPFARAVSMQDLKERRKRVSSELDADENEDEKCRCGLSRCLVM